jgi:large subunit ribosomal protein L21
MVGVPSRALTGERRACLADPAASVISEAVSTATCPTRPGSELAPGRGSSFVYAIVRCGGRQERASVDDVLTVDKLAGEIGSTVTLPAVLIVDDGQVISDSAELGGYQVTAEILGPVSGPKINMIHYKNKTGYRRRQGHRQKYTQVKITGIGTGKASGSKKKA